MAKLATLLYWKKTANDSRDTASDVGDYIIAQAKALKFAQAIENGELHERWPSGFRPGFGITIKYGSGRLRNVKAQY
jgi:hypothetical protein